MTLPDLDKLANNFERKVLFGIGRHFWHIVGVAGGIAVLTGGVLFTTSQEIKFQSYMEWLKQEEQKGDRDARELIGQLPIVERWQQRCLEDNSFCEYYFNGKGRIERIEPLMKTKYESYSVPISRRNTDNITRRIFSPFIISWGIGSLSAASVISAVLGIERNTRKD